MFVIRGAPESCGTALLGIGLWAPSGFLGLKLFTCLVALDMALELTLTTLSTTFNFYILTQMVGVAHSECNPFIAVDEWMPWFVLTGCAGPLEWHSMVGIGYPNYYYSQTFSP